ncbi:MAG TPA: hypothetical protein VG870_04210 [Chitinophagaceae bacterium]|nr:hypothetical protein [Chitinophagaceae bacterium]
MIFVQLLSIAFAVCLSIQQLPAINKMTDHGASSIDELDLHLFGWIAKGLFVVAVSWHFNTAGDIAEAVAMSAAWIFLICDPLLNVLRANRQPWWYLGDAKVDTWLKALLGQKAGIWKALAMAGVIIILNVL